MRHLGAICTDGGQGRFSVWAPFSSHVDLHIVSPQDQVVRMAAKPDGYHEVAIDGVSPSTRYLYVLESGREFPDPASRSQPDGVHSPSQVVSSHFEWHDSHWFGIPIEKYVIYEVHTGTFTDEGTFDSIIPRLDYVRDLGITALELMPIAQFPGKRNWGYDGVYPFAAQNSYGGNEGLKRLVDACHQKGVAVILDVVYNHVGPEGNYLAQFAPYFTDRYKTPWGAALNFDDAHSDHVRHFFFENALYWITDCHIDALRLDAVHAILDHSALHFVEELAEIVHDRAISLNRRALVIAESALNDTRLVRPTELGGYGLDAQWNDDFHHSLHTLLTNERGGYYADFGDFQHMAQAFSEGFVYSGHYSTTRQRRHGNSSRSIPPQKFVVYAQNHDQIGNRMLGDRLTALLSFEAVKLAAGLVLLSPFIPLLFMGDEYGETAPFQYFVSHSDPDLVESVRTGRKAEFAHFKWSAEPPDPQDEATFLRSKLNHDLHQQGRHRILHSFNRELIRLRKTLPALACLSKDTLDVTSHNSERVLLVRRWSGDSEVLTIFNFNDCPVDLNAPIPAGPWIKVLDSGAERWGGKGSAVPGILEATSDTHLDLNPSAVLLFAKETSD